LLPLYLPIPAHETLFGAMHLGGLGSAGSSEKRSCGRTATRLFASKRVPVIPVYVVSNTVQDEVGVRFLLRGMPVWVHRLRGRHFFPPTDGEEGANLEFMGADRLAAAKAAASLWGVPSLVIDAGTALTYTAVDVQGRVQGGGISPGIQLKLAALGEYSGGELPSLSQKELFETVDECKKKGNQALPLFSNDTEQSILSSVLTETAQHVGAIVKGWLKQSKVELEQAGVQGDDRSKLNSELKVIVSGGDGKVVAALLRPDHSNIVYPVRIVPTGFEVMIQQHVVTLGVQHILQESCTDPEKKSPNDRLRDAMLGQRVANVRKSGDEILRGTVASVAREEVVDQDWYTILYDGMSREEVDVGELYGKLS